ncbi:MAG TPA: M28 family metallopeptidase [Terriglobia bacterium]|nr:M28 family metallopeptidase [Terriglobia bacterium]
MLNPQNRLTVVACGLLVLIAMAVLVVHGLRQYTLPDMARISPQFDAASAMENTRVLAEQYPDRVTGTPAAGRAADYLSSRFRQLGYRVSTDYFSMWLAGKRVEGQNVIAELPGEVPERVALIAHYDGQFTSHQAAEDNASGVGTLLELARVLRSTPHDRGLIFVATDAEEWGMIGSRSLRGFFESRHTVAVISIDYLTAGRATGLAIDCEGQKAGYTPLWLREALKQSGILQGVSVRGPAPFREWVERSVEVSSQDQGPLLRVGIPALNVSTVPDDLASARARYHTAQDVFENFDPATFQMTGATIEQAVSYLDGMKISPAGEGRYLGLGGNKWLDRATVEWVQTLALLPFMVACVLAGLSFQEDQLPRILWRYLRPGMYVLPLFAALMALHALTSAGILKRYELYPATPKDPFLYTIPLRVAAPLLGVLLTGYIIVGILWRYVPSSPDRFAPAKRIFCVWMYVIVVGALYLSPYGLWFFLGPLAYAFVMLRIPSSLSRRLVNAALLLVGAAPLIGALYFFGQQTFLGWRILWYLVLQTAYGVWSTAAAVVFLVAIVIWFQIVVMAVLGLPKGVRRPPLRRIPEEDEMAFVTES